MTTLHATAIISAVDRASAVFHRVAASAKAAAGRYGAATAAMSRYGSGLGGALGAGAGFGSAIALRGEYEIDKISRLTQSAGELTDQQREMLERSAITASIAAAQNVQEIQRAQRELTQGGLDPDTVAAVDDMIAKISRYEDLPVRQIAEDAISVSNMLGFAMDTVENKVASLTKTLEFMSTVPNVSMENWGGLGISLKHAAPVARMLKIPVEELGAALAILADSGFKAEEGGTAFRTIMTRAISPTRQARLEMRAFGLSLEDLYTFNEDRLGDMQSMRERLLGAGLGQGVKGLDKVLAKFRDPSKFRDAFAMTDAMQEALMKALGIGKGDAESRGILEKAIGGHIQAATEGFDLEKYFKGIGNLPIQAMRQLFGLQRVSQAETLRDKINEIMELPSGERLNKFRHLSREFLRLSPGSIERRFKPVAVGFSWQIDRMGASLVALRNSIFSSGVGEDLVKLFDRLSSSIRSMRDSDPETLRNVTYALGGLAALGPAGFVIGGIAKSLETVATVMKNPAMRGLIVGGGIGALLGFDLLEPFMSPTWTPFGEETKTFLGPNAPIRQTATLVAELFKQIIGLANEAGTAVANLFDIDPNGSLLLRGISALNTGLETTVDTIIWFRKYFKGEDPGLPGRPGSWLRERYQESLDGALKEFDERQKAKARVGGFGEPRLRDLDPRVNGPVQVQGSVSGRVESDIRIIAPEGWRAFVEQQRGGEVTGTLDTGRSMPDTGKPKFGGPR